MDLKGYIIDQKGLKLYENVARIANAASHKLIKATWLLPPILAGGSHDILPSPSSGATIRACLSYR